MLERDYSIGRFISIIYRYRHRYISKILEPYCIGSGQYIYLLKLNKEPGLSQDKLSCYLKIDKATTAKAIKKLMENGYVERQIDQSDKRAYQVYLTNKGKEIIPVIIEAIKEWEKQLTKNIQESNIPIIKELLDQMAHNASYIDRQEVQNEKS